MKALLLRIGVLGTVLVLGGIAIANAQRGSNDAVADEPAAVSSGLPLRESSKPAARSPAKEGNPLRGSKAASTRPYPSSTSANQSNNRPDPFGLQARRSNNAAATNAASQSVEDSIPDAAPQEGSDGEPAQYSELASNDAPIAGPSLGPSNPTRSAGNRPTAASRKADNEKPRYSSLPATNDGEPAPFNADPSAVPAASNRSALPGYGNPSGETVADAEGAGQPGSKQLEGVQSPQLTIQKSAPQEIQVGKAAKFAVTVRNVGQAPACEVEIRDMVPKGTRLIDTTPPAARGTRGEMVWSLGTLKPGEESTVEMQVMPTAEGEIGSVATVHFGADASARCVATRPQLKVETSATGKALVGDKVVLSIVVSNPGSGVATGVVIEERIPVGLQHPAGAELEYTLGDLKPGESRKLELPLVAVQGGQTTNVLTVRGDGNLHDEHQLDIEVLAPQLDVAVDGPKRRYLERQAVYQFSVANPGTASAKQVELLAELPRGLKFVSANNAGHYEEATRTVHWRLEELPANERGSVELVTMPVEAGQHAIKVRSSAQKVLAVEKEQPVMIEGVAAILFQVSDGADPIQVGEETTFDVRIVNQGSKVASNVQLIVDLPAELKPIAADGQTRNQTDGNRVAFDGLASLAPKAETIYHVRVKALRSGDLRTRFQLKTDDMQTPVMKEESTRVYADE